MWALVLSVIDGPNLVWMLQLDNLARPPKWQPLVKVDMSSSQQMIEEEVLSQPVMNQTEVIGKSYIICSCTLSLHISNPHHINISCFLGDFRIPELPDFRRRQGFDYITEKYVSISRAVSWLSGCGMTNVDLVESSLVLAQVAFHGELINFPSDPLQAIHLPIKGSCHNLRIILAVARFVGCPLLFQSR